MRKQDKNEELIKMPVAKRSLFLTMIGVPMMFVAAFSQENIICLILSIIYIVLLLLNGIFSFPLIVRILSGKSKTR